MAPAFALACFPVFAMYGTLVSRTAPDLSTHFSSRHTTRSAGCRSPQECRGSGAAPPAGPLRSLAVGWIWAGFGQPLDFSFPAGAGCCEDTVCLSGSLLELQQGQCCGQNHPCRRSGMCRISGRCPHASQRARNEHGASAVAAHREFATGGRSGPGAAGDERAFGRIPRL